MRLLLFLLLLPFSLLYAQSDQSPAKSVKPIRIACGASIADQPEPLLIIDGRIVPYQQMNLLEPNQIKEIHVLRDETATALYGYRGQEGGVILVVTKSSNYQIPDFSINARHLAPCCWEEIVRSYVPVNHKVSYRHNGKRLSKRAFAALPLSQLTAFHIYIGTDQERARSKRKRVVVACW